MLVTGASRGIGAEIARLAGSRGHRVVINYATHGSEAESLAARINEAGGCAIAVRADVRKETDVARMFVEVDAALGPVDVLVNNAGIIGGRRRADAMDEAFLTNVFACNVFGNFYCTREALRRMSTRHGGRGGVVVNVSSAVSRHGGFAEETHYTATKGAIDSLTLALAKEVGTEGVRVVGVRPGLISTDIHDVHGGPALLEKLAGSIPIGHVGSPAEVAEAVLWLASPHASYVHGAIVDVSGGR
jgi:NAD(P)-dependent dehydrogenase (short-subunit alcohol dehydrogenase family)